MSAVRALLVCWWCAGAVHAAPTVVLRPDAAAAARTLVVGDVAEIGAEGALKARLAAVPLGAAPQPGEAATLRRELVARALRSHGLGDVAVGGAPSVRVTAAAQRVAGARLVDVARGALLQALAPAGGAPLLAVRAPVADLDVPPGAVTLRARTPGLSQALRPAPAVWVDVYVDGAFARSATVPLELRLPGQAWVANVALARGATLDCGALARRELDLASLGGVPAQPDCTGKLRVKHALAPGDPLLAGDLGASPPVAQGDVLRLRLVAGAIGVETVAVALRDGELGERIPVRPAAGRDALVARVTGRGAAVVAGEVQ